jgi:hypothetical protein
MSPESFLGLMAFTAFSVLAISRYYQHQDDRYDRQLSLEKMIDERGEFTANVNSGSDWAMQPAIPEPDHDRLAALIASGISKSRASS